MLPTLLDYHAMFGALPPGLTRSMAFLIDFYRQGGASDSEEVLNFFRNDPTLEEILGNTGFWGRDLNAVPGFAETVRKELRRDHSSR